MPVCLLALFGWSYQDPSYAMISAVNGFGALWAAWKMTWWLWTPLALLWMWRVHRADMAESRRHTETWRAAQAAWEEKRP